MTDNEMDAMLRRLGRRTSLTDRRRPEQIPQAFGRHKGNVVREMPLVSVLRQRNDYERES
jgi:hypothetical protein